MDPEMQQAPDSQESQQSHTLFFVGLLIAVVVAGGAALYIHKYVQKSAENVPGSPSDSSEEVVGQDEYLYITLADGGTREFSLYTFDSAAKAFNGFLKKIYPYDFMGYTVDHHDVTGEIAFFWSPIESSLDTYYPFERPMQLITFPKDDIENWLQWPTGPEFIKMNPNWTEDADRIVYEAFNGELTAEGLEQTDDWSIFISTRPPEGIQEAEGNAVRVDTGSFPHWLESDEDILYLKSDGVYIHHIALGMSRLVMPFENERTRATQLEVSEDGTRFVLTDEADTATVYEIISIDPFEVEEIAEIAIEGSQIFWPVYAPDNSAIAFIEAAAAGEFAYPDVYIATYTLVNSHIERQSSIGGPFNPRVHFLTDWSVE